MTGAHTVAGLGVVRINYRHDAVRDAIPQAFPAPGNGALPRRGAAPRANPRLTLEGWSIKKMEEILIRQALKEFDGNRSRAARELGINRTTLYNKLKVYESGD